MSNNSNVSYIILPTSLVVTFGGKTVSVNKDDVRYQTVLQAIKDDKLDDIPTLVDVVKSYQKLGISLKDNVLWLDGQPVGNAIGDRILAFQKEGIPFDNLIKFARKLRTNPSFNSREQLYKFLEHNGHPITTEGNFIAYRGVREDFKDLHTGTFDNRPGQVCEMERNAVDDNPNNTCSKGLHVACYDYAKGFASVLVEVEVDPRDVVCVPTDYNGTKMRTCKFKVVNICKELNTATLVDSSYEVSDEFSCPSDEKLYTVCANDCAIACDEHADMAKDEEEYEDGRRWEQLQLKPSDVVETAMYQREDQLLDVHLKDGSIYQYKNVPLDVTFEWEEYQSTGQFYVNFIVHGYKYTKTH